VTIQDAIQPVSLWDGTEGIAKLEAVGAGRQREETNELKGCIRLWKSMQV